MGEIADLMLDGTMCEGCGEILCWDGEPAGFPMRCDGCRPQGRARRSQDCAPGSVSREEAAAMAARRLGKNRRKKARQRRNRAARAAAEKGTAP